MKGFFKKKIFLKKNIVIGQKKTFVVAEISGNHCGNLEVLKKTILSAHACGADAVKIQSYEADTMTLNVKNNHFLINDESIWKGKYLYQLYKSAMTPFKCHKEIFNFTKKNKIFCFSSPFDLSSLKILENLNCPVYKVASPEIEDLNLIDHISRTMKPVIISTGIADDHAIKEALKICKKNNNKKIILLNCISSYPAKDQELNLSYINKLKKYVNIVGYSDHSTKDQASLISVALGAKVIEKHFILNKKLNSPDKSFSTDPRSFTKLVKEIRLVENMLGSEKINKKKIIKNKIKTVSRSFFYSRNVFIGEVISDKNIKSVRPGTGLPLCHYKKIIGKRIKKNRNFGDPVALSDFK
jgi:pseudaminic acid synthase